MDTTPYKKDTYKEMTFPYENQTKGPHTLGRSADYPSAVPTPLKSSRLQGSH